MRIADEDSNPISESFHVARCVRQYIEALRHELDSTACVAGHDRASTGHCLRNDQPERFRRRARVHDDVERAEHGVGAVDEPGESDAIGDADIRCQTL